MALTQDWGIAQDVAAAAAVVAGLRLPAARWRLPAPGALSLSFIAFVAYALLTPAWAYRWEFHPGNEPKTLRMAVALGHRASLDVEPVSAGMEALPTDAAEWRSAARSATGATETARMLGALARGDAGRDAIRATRVTRQTIRGKEGGVYHVLAPGPSLLLAPALRVDRWLNLRDGRAGRVAVSVLLLNALAALLVGAAVRAAARRDRPAGPVRGDRGGRRRWCRPSSSTSSSSTRRCWARWSSPWPCDGCSSGTGGVPPTRGRSGCCWPRCRGCTRSSCPRGACSRCGRA